MASVRKFKKEVTYLIEEVISDCYFALYFQPETEKDAIIGVINEAVELNNGLIEKINNPQEKNNPRLLKKYYNQLRAEMFTGVDSLFTKLSEVCKSAK